MPPPSHPSTHTRSQSRSNSRTHRPSRSSSSSSSSSSGRNPSRSKRGIKGTLLFLGAVAAATFAAHKYWPKGVIYGEKDDWEHDHHQHGKTTRRSSRHRVERSPSPGNGRYRERDLSRDDRKSRSRGRDVAVGEEVFGARGARGRSRRREVDDERDGPRGVSMSSVPVGRRDLRYPSASRRRCLDDGPTQGIYAGRDGMSMARRVSVDGVRRTRDGYN